VLVLYSSIAFVSFSESGYSFSSIALLNSLVSIGERKGVRSFTIVGLILYISFALFRFIAFIVLVTVSSVICCSVNVGRSVWFGSLFSMQSSFSIRGIVSVVFCPCVM
jgi:hypothetical protein